MKKTEFVEHDRTKWEKYSDDDIEEIQDKVMGALNNSVLYVKKPKSKKKW